MSLNKAIANPNSRVFRRAEIKRRDISTGLFESTWTDISADIKKWGKITTSIDSEQYAKFKFPTAKVVVSNDEGRYNPDDDANSLWFGFAPQERTLFRIQAGYLVQTLSSAGIWTSTEFPEAPLWDVGKWGVSSWGTGNTIFTGIISSDINLSDKNETTLTIKPLIEVFRQYPARRLTGWTSTGMTASQFMEMLRDQTDGSGGFIFRPFFGDTTGNWDISSTTVVYSNLNTSGAADVRDKTVWEIVDKLSQAENYVSYISNQAKFVFSDRNTSTGETFNFDFYGSGIEIGETGRTIKRIVSFGKRYTKYYSSVQVKHKEEDTSTSYETVESDFLVQGGNIPWYFGERTFGFENTWIPTATTANTLAQNIFDNVSNIKDEIKFTSSFVPHLNVLERITVTYDSSEVTPGSLWDANDWADTAGAAETGSELVWDASGGDAIKLNGDEFRLLKVEVDLDNFGSSFHARRA